MLVTENQGGGGGVQIRGGTYAVHGVARESTASRAFRSRAWNWAQRRIRSRGLVLDPAACFVAPKRSAKLTGVPPAALEEEGVRWTAMARCRASRYALARERHGEAARSHG